MIGHDVPQYDAGPFAQARQTSRIGTIIRFGSVVKANKGTVVVASRTTACLFDLDKGKEPLHGVRLRLIEHSFPDLLQTISCPLVRPDGGGGPSDVGLLSDVTDVGFCIKAVAANRLLCRNRMSRRSSTSRNGSGLLMSA